MNGSDVDAFSQGLSGGVNMAGGINSLLKGKKKEVTKESPWALLSKLAGSQDSGGDSSQPNFNLGGTLIGGLLGGDK